MMTRLDNNRAIQRRYYLLLIVLSWIAESYWSDAQGMTRRPLNTVAIYVISDGLSLPRSGDDYPSIEPSAVPTLLVHLPVLTANPTADDSPLSSSSIPSGAASTSMPWSVPPAGSHTSGTGPSSTVPSTFPTAQTMYPSRIPTKEPASFAPSSVQQLSSTSDSPSAIPSSPIMPPSVVVSSDDTQSGRTPPPVPAAAVESQMAVDQVLLKTNEGFIMQDEQASEFEHVCETEFFPIYLVQVYPANYTDITCTVMNQSISATSDIMESNTLAVLLRVTSYVTMLTSPSFDDIVAEVVSAYTPELQEILMQSSPEQSYFAKTKTIEFKSTNHKPVVAIIASTLGIAFIILGLGLIFASRKRYQGSKLEPIKAVRLENQSSSGDDSLYNDLDEHPKATIARHLDHVFDYDDVYGPDLVEPVIYEKMSLRSQHERRTYNMSPIGLSSAASGVSSVTDAPSSMCSSTTGMTSTIMQSPAARSTSSPRSNSDLGGGCSAGLIIPPIMERLYYETLHSTLRLAKRESSSGVSTTTSSSKRRGELYSQMDDDESDDENSNDEPTKPLPSLIVAITEMQQDETKEKSNGTTNSSSTEPRGGGKHDNVTGDASSKDRELTPSVDSSRRSSSSRSSSRSRKGKRNHRGRQRRTSPLTPRRRGGGKGALASPRQEDNQKNNHDSDDEKFRMYSHTSAEEMMTTDDKDDTKKDKKLPSVIITITQQEITKKVTTRTDQQSGMMPPRRDEDISSSLLPVLGVLSHPPKEPPKEEQNNNVSRAFSSRSMGIHSNSLNNHGGGEEIIQSVETELSSFSASVGTTMTRDGSSSHDDANDSSNDAASSFSESDNTGKRRDRMNRIVNI